MPKVVSLGFALPKYSASQEEALEAMGWKSPLAKRIFMNAEIERRYSYIPIKAFGEGYSWQEATQIYKSGAIELGIKACQDALDNYNISDVGQITFISVTGYECPSLSYHIAAALGLNADVVHSNILGQGCEAAIPGLERSFDYVSRKPNKLALAVSVEICSATWYPAPETDIEYLVSSAIFGDGATAAVVGNDDDPRHPTIIDFESYYSPDFLDLLGYEWKEGRLKVVLSARVPEIVPPLIRQTVDILLSRNNLTREDVSHWIMHPGGKSVLDNIENELGLTKEQTYWSWETMKRFGNMSSATIGAIVKLVQANENPTGYGIIATMGAGTAVNATLVKWE